MKSEVFPISGGEGILKLSDLDSMTIFIGGYSETLRFGPSDNFHFGGGGVFWNSRIWTLWQFSFGGVFWNSRIWTLWQFSFLGGYSQTLGFGLSDNFHVGGYSETLRFGLSDNFHFGGYSETLGFGLSDNFHFGGYSETLRFGLYDNFHVGGYSETLRFGLYDNFHLGGILNLLDLDSLTIFIWGGYSKTLEFGLSDNFHFLGGYSETLGFGLSDNFHWWGILKLDFGIGGILEEFGQKFSTTQQAHASQIVSHILRMWRLKRSEYYSPRVEGWIPVRGNFFALIQFWQNWQDDLFEEKLDCFPFWLTALIHGHLQVVCTHARCAHRFVQRNPRSEQVQLSTNFPVFKQLFQQKLQLSVSNKSTKFWFHLEDLCVYLLQVQQIFADLNCAFNNAFSRLLPIS